MKPTRFILVDDDNLNNMLSKLFIKRTLPNIEIVDFTLPEKGFHYMETAFTFDKPIPSILLLDINMPIMDGWEFLKKYSLLDKKIQEQITVYILSSSVDKKDQDFSADHKNVKRYLVKPITLEAIKKIYEENDFAIYSPG